MYSCVDSKSEDSPSDSGPIQSQSKSTKRKNSCETQTQRSPGAIPCKQIADKGGCASPCPKSTSNAFLLTCLLFTGQLHYVAS